MANTDEYTTALDNALTAANSGPGWDARFLAGLEKNGLKLSSTMARGEAYPGGTAYNAPRPFDTEEAWPADTYVVYK